MIKEAKATKGNRQRGKGGKGDAAIAIIILEVLRSYM
jgi:hypothetical protein